MSWKPEFLVLIMLSTVVDFYCSKQIAKTQLATRKKIYLMVSLGINLGILCFFKYANFITGSLADFLDLISIDINLPYSHIILPVGISFYTFQTISYTIDVYKGKIQPEKHLGIFATYISFFPQLVAGPIERAAHLLPQFREHHLFTWENMISGLKMMIRGLFIKVVIADRIALLVNPVFASVTEYSGIGLFIAGILFGIQIYCDFAGYSIIACGTAKIMGFDLMKNFSRPYFATSIGNFWRRWHISLSARFRDYVYIPLGGNRVTKAVWIRNILYTFLLSGLWHGANRTFVVWGGLHGSVIVLERFLKWDDGSKTFSGYRPVFIKILQIIIVYSIVTILWVFFRANSFTDARYVFTHMFDTFVLPAAWSGWGPMGAEFRLSLLFIGLLWIKERCEEYLQGSHRFWDSPWFQWSSYIVLILIIAIFFVKGEQDFIYFQF